MDIGFAIRRLKQLLGQANLGTSHTPDFLQNFTDGEDSVNYVEAPYTHDEGIQLVVALISQARAEQCRRERIIARIADEYNL